MATGPLAATETGADTIAAAGRVVVSGSLAATDGHDTFSGSASVIVAGPLYATEAGADVFAAGGAAVVTGNAGLVESAQADVFASLSTVLISGSATLVEDADVFAVDGSVLVAGALVASEAGQDAFSAQISTTWILSVSGSVRARPALSGGTALLR